MATSTVNLEKQRKKSLGAFLKRMNDNAKNTRTRHERVEKLAKSLRLEEKVDALPKTVLSKQKVEQQKQKRVLQRRLPSPQWYRWEETEVVRTPSFDMGWGVSGHAGVSQLTANSARIYAGSLDLFGPAAQYINESFVIFSGGLIFVDGHDSDIFVSATSHAEITYHSIKAQSYDQHSWGEVTVSPSLNVYMHTGSPEGFYTYDGYTLVNGFSRKGDWWDSIRPIWIPDRPNPRPYNKVEFSFNLPPGNSRWFEVYFGLVVEAQRFFMRDRCTAEVILDCVMEPIVVKIRKRVKNILSVANSYYFGPKPITKL